MLSRNRDRGARATGTTSAAAKATPQVVRRANFPGEAEDMVEVRYATTHDYRIVSGEKGPGKIIPQWVVRGHRAYARYLLDEAARGIREKTAL